MNENFKPIRYRGYEISKTPEGSALQITKGNGVYGYAMTQALAERAIDALHNAQANSMESSDGL